MLLSFALAFFCISALFNSAARATPFHTRKTEISCEILYNRTWTASLYGPNNSRPVGFTNARDAQGRLQLSTSVNGIPTSSNSTFIFANCESTAVRGGGSEIPHGYTHFYGQLRRFDDQRQCATVATNATDYQPIVSAECLTEDNSDLRAQWWSMVVMGRYDSGFAWPSYLGSKFLDGFGEPNPYDLFVNVASGNATLVEAGYVANGTGQYSLSLDPVSVIAQDPPDQSSSATAVLPLLPYLFWMNLALVIAGPLVLCAL
ncbi:hypothetical protein OC846_003592 [Tilletia horrida]|uniref:Ricin B lectin domain-containing protein n=1 Tax=Tilletia horrida TaxID=155126 RepID=A0AAN6JTR2_9BASI|nr:hypothetical protein OC846_003592 [Tilletia horrida]KAK0550897.1 hypothetical protein OC845_002460 [Tilletia horrida]KAK0565727.1 hypothetical protein OC861_003597 [Tilletia horrida]